MAIELGANLLGEIIIFVFGAGVLLVEYQRQARKETLKEEMALQEKYELQATLNELAFQAERQDTQIRELTRIIADLGQWTIKAMNFTIFYRISLLVDSKSWTPKILNDIGSTVLGRKKIQGECKDLQDNPLELLPERRSKIPLRSVPKETSSTYSEPGKEQTLNQAINFLLTEVFYSRQQSSPVEEMKGDSALVKSLNYLFVESEDTC